MKIKILLITIFLLAVLIAVYGFSRYKSVTIEGLGQNGVDYQTRISQRLAQNPKNETVKLRLSGWVAWWDEDQSLASLEKEKDKIDVISPVWYNLEKNGQILKRPDLKRERELGTFAVVNNKELLPTITNDFDPARVSTLLDSEDLTNQQIDNLVYVAKTQGYKGWDLDWEEMEAGDKPGFSDFVQNLADALHHKNMILSVSVQAQTGKDHQRRQVQAQDWSTIGKYADIVRVMAYDFHDSNSPPGPVTPMDDYEKVLNYAVSVIPKEKIVIGLPTYGYDWVGEKGVPVQHRDVINILQQLKTTPQRDKTSSALYATYTNGQKHTVWFEDKESTQAKVNLARTYGLYRFCFWRIGGEDEGIWNIE